MFPEVSALDPDILSESGQVADIQGLVTAIRDGAIDYAISKLPAAIREQDLIAVSQRDDFLSHFKCGLAKGIGDLLLENDGRIQEVYLFDPAVNPDLESGDSLPTDATLHLLVVVRTPSAALEALITALDRALSQSLKERGLPVYAHYRSVLDIIPITDEDVRRRRGFATLLTSIFAPPIRVC